ncbi:hypothetical protein BYT27DRAFT_7223944 [Phlegmacium glaucopus]|nr:hypothetical protein BYT27DRAFT_7223944 [Phlegmacium glaucopus]
MTHTSFGATLFDCSGEIRAQWHYTSQESYARLITGLAYSEEGLLGYDLSLERDLHGNVEKLHMKNEWYSVIKVVFSNDDGKQLVVKDTWVDVERQYKEREFLEASMKLWIANVPKLHCTEEVAVNGTADSTRSHRVHCRLLLDPVCTSIQHFKLQKELLQAFINCIKGMS